MYCHVPIFNIYLISTVIDIIYILYIMLNVIRMISLNFNLQFINVNNFIFYLIDQLIMVKHFIYECQFTISVMFDFKVDLKSIYH